MPTILPISKNEFYHLLQRCTPPNGWPNKIAVANSGGPDSTCLLFLLRSLIQNTGSTSGFVTSLLSIHVNHDLQNAAKSMAERAEQNAGALGVDHCTARVPWGTPPFPPRPTHGQALEKLARDARRNRLFHAMVQNHAHVVAFGQHADDQVETVLMRLAAGSGLTGAAGMRPIRRMGMGDRDSHDLTYFGLAGMDRWVVRPLLTVSKDRILATCEANGLEYVHDPTNFQPELTLRNAVRTSMTAKSIQPDSQFASQLSKISSLVKSLLPSNDDIDRPAHLYQAVQSLGRRFEEVETRATHAIQRCILPSPPSTVLLSAPALRSALSDDNNEVRTSLVRRILRYVSPHPWGSLSAEARGDRNKLQRIIKCLWETDPEGSVGPMAVSGVLWAPLALRPNGELKTRVGQVHEAVWFVHRQPPERRTIKSEMNPVSIDITQLFSGSSPEHFEVLYDNRFALTFSTPHVPDDLAARMFAPDAHIVVEPDTRWFAPRLVLRRAAGPDEVLARLPTSADQWEDALTAKAPGRARSASAWVTIRGIRTLNAV